MASLDEYFKKRMDGVGASLQTTSPAPEKPDPAKSYIDRISQTLSGKDPVVQNARQEAGTKNAVSDYLANRQAKQENVNAGYSPGTLQSQRTQDRYQAVSNESALARDAGVNDLARQRTDTAMLQSNQLRQEGNQEIETLINSIQDPVTQAYLRRIQAAGGDVRSAMVGNTTITGGQSGNTVNPIDGTQTIPTNPGTGTSGGATGYVDEFGRPRQGTEAELAAESARDWMKNAFPDLDPNSAEYKELYEAQLGGAKQGEINVIIDANNARKLNDAQTKASSNFSSLTPDETALLLEKTTSFSPLEIPVGTGIFEAFKATNPLVQIGGQLYKPVTTMEWRQGKNRDFSVFQAQDGTYLYVDRNGKTTTEPAPTGSAATHEGRAKWMETFK